MSSSQNVPHLPQRGRGHGRGGRGSRGRGRGGGGGRGQAASQQQQAVQGGRRNRMQVFKILDGVDATPLLSMGIPDLDSEDHAEIRIQNFEHLGSYNWVNQNNPTILVPGHARILKTTTSGVPFQVPGDKGIHFVDQNRHRMGSRAIVPLFVSVNRCREQRGLPPLRWAGIDFVTDRNNLRNLLRFVNKSTKKDFRIDLQLAGTKTVLCTRWTERPRVRMDGYTYGFNFEKVVTTEFPGCEGSTSHHRTVSYDMNGLRLAVRFEVDACKVRDSGADSEGTEQITSSSSNQPATSAVDFKTGDVDGLVGAMSSINLSPTNTAGPSSDQGRQSVDRSDGVSVKEVGREIHPEDLVELTTRASRGFNWDEEYPQLWLSQTTNHWLAMHSSGNFTQIEERRLEFGAPVREQQQAQFKKLRKLLGEIQALVIQHGHSGQLSLVFQKKELKLYRRTSNDSCLPDHLLATIV